MKNRNRVVWTKGMFLTPQHFQVQDQFFEDSLQFRAASSQFANWGVTELEIDRDGASSTSLRAVNHIKPAVLAHCVYWPQQEAFLDPQPEC